MQNDLLDNREEFVRKLIHIGCSVIPLSYLYYFSREQIIYISGFISFGFVLAEIMRNYSVRIQKWFIFVFKPLLREDEKEKKITGATFLFVSLTIIFIFFDKSTAIASALILTIADSFAAITGKKLGRKKFLNKTVTGSITFFLFGNVILFMFLPELGLLNFIVATILTFIEALSLPVSDNLTLPVSACLLAEVMFFIKGGVI
jgi:dolichol kinase